MTSRREDKAHKALKAAWDFIRMIFDASGDPGQFRALAEKAVETRDAYAVELPPTVPGRE